jgi:polygalacturonase
MKLTYFILFLFIIQSSWAQNVFLITKYGAKTNSPNNAPAIQKAIDACSKNGGGTVIVPVGKFITGTLIMKNNTTLYLEMGAFLIGSQKSADYPPQQFSFRALTETYTNKALIYAEKAENIVITGEGVIDGNGASPEFQIPKGVWENDIKRPNLIRFVSCKNIKVENITLKNSANWMQHYLDCEKVRLHKLNVFNHANRNNDGIDIDGCKDVVISDCIVDADDDALCLKGTGGRGCEDVTVTNCILGSNCNSLKFGTETTGGFKNITVANCILKAASQESHIYIRRWALTSIALEIVDGGAMENVLITNMTVSEAMTPIFIRLGNRARKHFPEAENPPQGTMKNIILSNIQGSSFRPVSNMIMGIPDGIIENVTLSNIRLRCEGKGTKAMTALEVPEKEKDYPENKMFGTSLPAYGLFVRHVRGLTLENISFSADTLDERPALWLDDVQNFKINGLQANSAGYASNPLIQTVNTTNGVISNSFINDKITKFIDIKGGNPEKIILLNNQYSTEK